MKKRVFSFVAAVLMVVTFGVPAGAESEFTTGDFTTADALTVLRAAVGLESLTYEQSARFGFYHIISYFPPETVDALRILRIAVGILPQPDYVIIRGIQYCTTITELNLAGQRFTSEDIIPLRQMVNLEELIISGTSVTDLTPLSELTNLRSLILSRNQVTDLPPLGGLTALRSLMISNNPISDLTPLGGLTSLRNLVILDSSVSDLTPLSELKNLKILELIQTEAVDLTPLKQLTDLEIFIWQNMPLSHEQLSSLREALPRLNIIT
jgi:hypothetical protein